MLIFIGMLQRLTARKTISTKAKKEQSLSYLDGHTRILKKNVNSSQKPDIWELKFSLQMNTFQQTNGLNKGSLILGGSAINPSPTSSQADWEQETNSER